MKSIYSQEGFLGEIIHCDENGYIGHSERGIIDGWNHYDANGNYIGYSQEGLFGEMNHYRAETGYEGTSVPGMLGGAVHYMQSGGGYSVPSMIDGTYTYLDDAPAGEDSFESEG